MLKEIEIERQVLVIFPHPDDEAFGVSGTIATYTNMNVPVTYACLTLGEMGRNLGNPPFATRESLPEIRKVELQKAAEALNITDLRMMGLRDKTLEFEDDAKMTKLVTDLIDELNPSLIISFYPGFSVHPDHEATARAVVRAVEQMNQADRPKLHLVAFSNDTLEKLGEPDIVYDISHVFDQKMDAMRAHISQTIWLLKEMEAQLAKNDEETVKRVKFERFWTYSFKE
ncbi:bacillithiol biosynthesis deacetylase BshB2 [Bacillus ectoiniformans]|uniref:bacillithiol biosynthesis deacetylase BshB2 n=1 Tax=Bacillus ectoiniformans TaxID=1494429 RepID=UPI00195C4D2C|nr:bacillithiol biosynthesis deacetylase BshB2 [Bacillus ectoiniformans]MBM7648299.1 bacillithiol biosynthesis deacetylase BshB2 [Bacillus ectoiniformans]